MEIFFFFILILLGACTNQETDILVETATLSPQPKSTDTFEPSETTEPKNTVVPFPATATHLPTLTPAFETGTLMKNKVDSASMVYVPSGEFMMGNDAGSPSQRPAHLVSTNGF